MPNFKVLQDVPSELRTRLYGLSGGTTDTAVVVDPSGVLAIQDNGSSITVDAVDLDVRDLSNASDSVLVYGNDGTDNRAILTDTSGVLAIQDNGSSITVDAVDLDVRDLSNASDSVLIYGNDGTDNRAILTDTSGVLAIQDNGSSITVDAVDLDVRDLSNASDSVLIYGNDGTDNRAILTDTSGVLAIQDNGSSITVDAVDLDVRDLSNASDSVLIYGNDGTNNRVILTDASGVLQVAAVLSFTEATEVVATATALVGSTARDASTHPNYTWFVKNTEVTNSATVQLEISPNETDWLLDGTSQVVAADSAITLEPNVFLKFTRIAYQSTTAGSDTTLQLIWQAYGD